MISQIGILSDNFYKFLTSLSLITSVYCASFDLVFGAPHNKLMMETNMESAKATADWQYLFGISEDLTGLLDDSVLKRCNLLSYGNEIDTSERIAYYSSIGLSKDVKLLVDSLNLINKRFAEVDYKLTSIKTTIRVAEANVNFQWWKMNIIGFVSFAIFLFGLYKWYKLRKIIDEKK